MRSIANGEMKRGGQVTQIDVHSRRKSARLRSSGSITVYTPLRVERGDEGQCRPRVITRANHQPISGSSAAREKPTPQKPRMCRVGLANTFDRQKPRSE
jgi:hypothetical protein